MRKIFSLLAVVFMAMCMFADPVTLTFKDWGDTSPKSATDSTPNNQVSDYGKPYTTANIKDSIEGSEFLGTVTTATKLYAARVGYGCKLGTGSANGQFVANLASPAQFDSIVFVASSYSTSEGSVKICGGDVIDLTNGGTDNKVLKRLVYVPTGIVDSISFETTAKRAYLKSIIFYPATDSTGGSDPVTPGAGITYELNGGVANTYGWTTPDEMFATFMAESGATDFSTLADYKAMTDPLAGTGICAKLNNPENCFADTAKWGWLMTYIMSVHAAQAAEGASALAAAGSGSAWRYAVGAFFIDGQRATWPKSANFATCGVSTYGAYSAVWQNAFANPTNPTGTFTLNEPYKANNTFDGWYAAADFSGAKVTTVDSTTTGTLYAKWIEYIPTLAEVKAMADNTNTKASGVVTYINGKNVYVQDTTGGLLLYMKANPTFNVGDKVVVSGQKVMYGGAPELKNGVEVSAVIDSIPAATSFATLADACQEANMFTLVNVNNLEIVSLDSYNNPTVSDGTTTLLCYRMAVDTAVFKVGTHVDVTAVLGYFNDYQFVGDAAGIQLAQDTVPGEQPTSVTFNVIVPANTPDCYIAGSFNNWTHQQMTKLTDSTYTFTAGSVVLSTLEYKYCAGPDWAYVEVDADGYDVMNRSWQAQDRVAMWLAIPQDTVPTDDIMTIAQVKALENNTETQVEGVVTFINGRNVYIQDATGGLLLYMSATPTFAVGDKVVVSGMKAMYGGAPELKNGVEVSAVIDSIPAATSFATLADACQEANMFTLVNVNNLEIVSLDSYNNPTVSDGTTTLLCYRMAVDTAVFKVGTHVDVTAVLGYFNDYQFVGDAAGIQLAQDTVPGEQPTSVTFNVIVPANTPDCYIAGSFNNWTHQQMTKLTDSTYTYVYSAVNLIIDSLEYKYCAGNGWEYVEKDSLGWEIPNRRWQALDRVATWLAVPQDTVPQDTVPGEQLTSVTFNVIVPANTPDCYIAGSFNNWTHQQMTKLTDSTYTFTAGSVVLSTLEYKYCAGPDWAYVEVDADGYDVMNRSWQAQDRVAMWLAIPQDTVPTDDIPTLAEVKAMADSTNTKASGVVTFINGRNVYIQDATGGLNLYMSATPTFAVGDKVVVSGTKAVYGGAPELTNGVEVSAVAASIPAAASFATLADACQEANMFTLVNVNNLEIVGFGSYSNPYVSDGTTTLLCYRMVVDTAVFKVGTHVDVTAVLGYYNGYQFVGDVAGIQLAQDTVPGEQPTSVTFHVLVPDNTPTCYIAGSFNNWTHQQMTQLTANTYTYTANNIDMATLAYKYCAGNGWAYVEKDANGNDVMDRTWHEYDTVAAWANTNLVHDGLYYEITSMNTVSVIPDPTGGNYLNLTNVVIPDTVVFNYTTYQVTGIASQAFYDCTSMTTLEVGENIEQVGMAAFFGCSNLTSVVWSAKNCSEISDGNSVYAFFSATSLTDFRFGTSVETIPSALCAFRDQLTTITIPTGVKAINRYAFYGCSSLATVNLPGTLMAIGYGTFSGCESLTKTNFTGNLKQWCEIFIESDGSPVMYSQNLYINDVLLTHADIPEGTTAVNSFSFTNDTCLISATVPNSVTFIGTHSFNGCTNIETIEVGNGVTDLASIDNWNSAFSNCQKLKKFVYNSTMADDLSVDFWFTSPEIDTLVVPANMINNAPSYYPDHIRYIEVIDGEISSHGLSLFKANGSSLGSLLLAGASNTTLEDKAFYELYKLTNLSLPQNLQTIPYKMAADCYMLENIVIPSSVTTIGNNAFENCRSLDSVDFGTTTALQQIGNWAFYNCHNLPTLTIPEGVTYVGDGAFYGCSYLTELTLPSTMLTMGDNSFALCSRLQKMNVSAAIPPTIASKTFKDVLRSIPVYVPKASVSLYKTDEYWREFNIIGGEEQESAVDNISSEGTTKIFRDGQVLIYHNGKCYDMMGNLVE